MLTSMFIRHIGLLVACLLMPLSGFTIERFQNSPLQDVPLWSGDYFEVKAILYGLKRTLCPSLTELQLRALPLIRVTNRTNFL